MLDENMERLKIEQMRRFYEIFPYPNRAFFITPYLESQVQVHGAFSKLLAENQIQGAKSIKYNQNLENVFPLSNRILLVGCGTDEPLLFRMLHPQHEIVCLDLSKKNIKIARKKLFFRSILGYFKFIRAKYRKTEFIVGDANEILKQKCIGQFNYIQCFGVVHHQPNPEALISSMSERLALGGTLRMMVYSYYGRALERKIQKKYNALWNNLSKVKRFKLIVFYNFFLLRIWQFFNFFGFKKSTYLRFKYLRLNSKIVADALMHPSDPGLCLEDIIPMCQRNHLSLIYCQAKIEAQGLVCGYENPMETWNNIVDADKKRNLLSNPILILKKDEK